MSVLLKYRVEIQQMLDREGLPGNAMHGVIFVTPARAVELVDPILLTPEETVIAARNWAGREDPYGFAPSEDRTVAIISPLC